MLKSFWERVLNSYECLRNSDCVKSFINVTTDKVYLNKEWTWGNVRMKNLMVLILTQILSHVQS